LNIPRSFENGTQRVFCCSDCCVQYNNSRKLYEPSDARGVPWEESPGFIKAKIEIAKRDRRWWQFRCRSCGSPIEHEVNMIEENGHHYCSSVCHTLRLTDLMMRHMRKNPPRYKEFLASIEPEGIST
jgi:hypothetical protein